MKRVPSIVQVSCRCYRALLRLYPAAFRERFQDDIMLDFMRLSIDAHRTDRLSALIPLWLRSFVDLVSNAICMRMAEMKKGHRPGKRGTAVFSIALMMSGLLGYLNLHNDEVQLPFGLLLLSTFLLGLAKPQRAWIWATIVALSIPASSLLSLKIGVYYPCRPDHPYSCEPTTLNNALSTSVLLLPALGSAYLGALTSRSLSGTLER